MTVRRYRPIIEALALLAVTLPLAIALRLPTLWFVAPFAVLTFTRRSYATYGLSLHHPGSVAFHAAVSAAVFIPYLIGHYLWAHWWFGATFHLQWPADFVEAALDQVVIIALPEEFFFRGYLQTECDRVWGTPYRFLGASWGIGLPFAALVFAACHVIHGGPVRLSVFFPAMLYGWLRARTDTIAVPTLYHAASNVLMQVMLTSLSG